MYILIVLIIIKMYITLLVIYILITISLILYFGGIDQNVIQYKETRGFKVP